MFSKLIHATLFMAMAFKVQAQEAIFRASDIVSPEISSDGKVTFRVYAPNARAVKVSGDWLPPDGFMPGSAAMTRNDKGVWSHTTAVLAPEL